MVQWIYALTLKFEVLQQSSCFIQPDLNMSLWLHKYMYLLWSHQQPSVYISWQGSVMISSSTCMHTIHINGFVRRNSMCENEYTNSLNYTKFSLQKIMLYLLWVQLSIDLNINLMKILLLLYIILKEYTCDDSSYISLHNFAKKCHKTAFLGSDTEVF
jgi:hypothetical protein